MILGWREQMVWGTFFEHTVLEMEKKKKIKIKMLCKFCFMRSEHTLVTTFVCKD